MNKKGFTLVEILAVIVILSLIITIVATNGFGAFNNSKNKIKENALKEVGEGVKVLLTDVEYCDEDINDEILDKFVTLGQITNKKCDLLEEKVSNEPCLNFNLSDLKSLNYVSSDAIDDLEESNSIFNIKACLKNNVKEITLTCDECDENIFKGVPEDIVLIKP